MCETRGNHAIFGDGSEAQSEAETGRDEEPLTAQGVAARDKGRKATATHPARDP